MIELRYGNWTNNHLEMYVINVMYLRQTEKDRETINRNNQKDKSQTSTKLKFNSNIYNTITTLEFAIFLFWGQLNKITILLPPPFPSNPSIPHEESSFDVISFVQTGQDQ